jgi:site-specific recombinase XerD
MHTGSEVVPAGLAQVLETARSFLAAAKAESTRRAYASDWRDFEAWCRRHRLPPLPAAPTTVALYLADRASTHRPATLRRRLTVIHHAHRSAGLESPGTMQQPLVSETLKGIRRTVGTAQTGKRPFYTAELRAMIAAMPETLQGVRDRALLLVGFAGGFRRSELAALTMEHVAGNDGRVDVPRRLASATSGSEARAIAAFT